MSSANPASTLLVDAAPAMKAQRAARTAPSSPGARRLPHSTLGRPAAARPPPAALGVTSAAKPGGPPHPDLDERPAGGRQHAPGRLGRDQRLEMAQVEQRALDQL